ncbi:hypothetical protein [Burkholderia lata]|nr:hypothetical protein [Burkholderia lata]
MQIDWAVTLSARVAGFQGDLVHVARTNVKMRATTKLTVIESEQ